MVGVKQIIRVQTGDELKLNDRLSGVTRTRGALDKYPSRALPSLSLPVPVFRSPDNGYPDLQTLVPDMT